MKHSSPPPIYCYFSLDHLEARLRQDQGWTPQLGTTSADVVRSGVVMVEFLNALLGDPRVHECFQRLYERVFDGSIDNYLDHARHYQDITLKDLQQFVEDTLDFPRPQVFPSSLAMHLDSAFWSHAYSLHSGEPGAARHFLYARLFPATCA